MNNDQDLSFSRAMMAGLFVGIMDTIICLAYNIGYRDITGYSASMLINVSSLIFGVNLLLLVIGMIYGGFIKMFGRRDVFFIIVFSLVTLFFCWKTEIGHRFADRVVNNEFRGLLLGVVLILGISAVALPLMYRSKFFDKYVL